jgi:hypothetical protein
MFDKLKIFFKVSDFVLQELTLLFKGKRRSVVCADLNMIDQSFAPHPTSAGVRARPLVGVSKESCWRVGAEPELIELADLKMPN